MTFNQFLSVLNARRKLILFTFFLTVGFSVILTTILPKTYKAEATVVVNFKGVDLITGDKVFLQLQTQSNIIGSLKVALKVVDILGLASEPSYVERFYKKNDGKGDIREFIAEDLKKNMRVVAIPGNKVITIIYEASNPSFAAAVANAYTKAYIDVSLELKIEPSKRATQWFEQQVAELRSSLVARQNELFEFQKNTGTIDADGKLDFELSQLNLLNNQLFEAKSELFLVNAQLNEINKDKSNFSDIVKDKYIDEINSSLLEAELEFSRTLVGVSKNHPDYVKLSSKVSSLRKAVKKEVAIAYKRLESKKMTLEKRVQRLESSVLELKNQVIEKNEVMNKLNVIKNKMSESADSLHLAVQRLNEISLEGRSSESDIAVLTKAFVPTSHSKPKMVVNVILGVILGLLLAFGFALIAELLNRKVRVEDDVTVSVGLPVLGEIQNSTHSL